MTNPVIEAMARAFAESKDGHPNDWEWCGPHISSALQVLKENVSEEMTTAGVTVIDAASDDKVHNMPHTLSAAVFEAMLSVAMEAQTDEG